MCPLPPISRFEDILDLAWDVLEGNPVAAEKFTRVLDALRLPQGKSPSANLFRKIEDGFRSLGHSAGLTKASYGAEGTSMLLMFRQQIPGPSPGTFSPCLLTPERFLPVASAALFLSASIDEDIRSLASLEDGLCGIGLANDLLAAGHQVLRGSDPRSFRSLVHFWGQDCGPDDGPARPPLPLPDPACPPGFTPPRKDPCWIDRHHCLFELLDAFRQARQQSRETYVIESLSDTNVCPGDTIMISGSNFGDTSGEVIFTSVSGGSVTGNVLSWSDTVISVRVPPNAGNGPVHLKVLERVITACSHSIPIHRQGNEIHIGVDNPVILALRANGQVNDICVEPGATIRVDWSATHNGVTILLEDQNGSVIETRSGLPATGVLSDFRAPNADSETRLRLTARVTSTCGSHELVREIRVTIVPVLQIEGVEFTQGVQRFWREGIVPNSIPTIAGKDTIMRVYVSCQRNGFAADEVEISGIVHVDGLPLFPINGITPISPAGNPFIQARRMDLIDRQETDHTLNFRIPAAWCSGTRNIRINIFTTENFCRFPISETLLTSRSWQQNPALRVRFVRIRDDSQNPATPRPTEEQCRFTVERAFDLIPSPATDIGPAWRPTWNTGLDFTGDDDDLRELLGDLNDEHNCNFWEWLWGWTGWTECPDDDGAIWVGFSRNFNRGMARRPGNTCISAVYQDTTGDTYTTLCGRTNILRIKTAHEIGHNLSMCHIDVGGALNACYDHPDDGALQDIPFDPYWNQTVPAGTTDFMGYGCPRWSSADSWQRMINFI